MNGPKLLQLVIGLTLPLLLLTFVVYDKAPPVLMLNTPTPLPAGILGYPSPIPTDGSLTSEQLALDIIPPASPSTLPGPVLPLLAWTVAAADGAVFVVDSARSLYQLDPASLTPLARSEPLFEAGQIPDSSRIFGSTGKLHLLADETYLFVANPALTQTLVLRRNDLSLAVTLPQAGPMTLDPGRRLLMIPQSRTSGDDFRDEGVWTYDLTNLSRPPLEVIPSSHEEEPSWNRANALHLVADPAVRQLYVSFRSYPGSHPSGSYTIYHLDTFEPLGHFGSIDGLVGLVSVAAEAGMLVMGQDSVGGPLRSGLLVVDRAGQEIHRYSPFEGQPVIDAAGDWIYWLRADGLWVLKAHDLSLQVALPFLDTPPAGLLLSPTGQTLYLFGSTPGPQAGPGWLAALDTAELRAGNLTALPLTPPGLQPGQPLCTECGNLFVANDYPFNRPLLYPSPAITDDQTLFIRFPYGYVYRTTGSGHAWSLVPALSYPDFEYINFLSLSPDFAGDRTLTADSRLRSTDGGETWLEWTPPIAFVSDREGNRDLYLLDPAGHTPRRLTYTPENEENPAWSPAWTRLAFQSNRRGNWDIFSMRVDCEGRQLELDPGCDLRQLTSNDTDELQPAWSPDGRLIAYVSTQDGNPEIYVMTSAGLAQRRLTFNPAGDWRPAWLADSRHLVFTSGRGGNNDLYRLTVPLSTSPTLTSELELAPLVTHPADDRDPAIWGSSLFFLSDRDGFTRVYRLDLEAWYNLDPEAVTPANQVVGHPARFDNSGKLLVSMDQAGSIDIYSGDQIIPYIPLTNSPAFDGQPAGASPWYPEVITRAMLADLPPPVPLREPLASLVITSPQAYTDPDLGFSLQYDPSWQLEAHKGTALNDGSGRTIELQKEGYLFRLMIQNKPPLVGECGGILAAKDMTSFWRYSLDGLEVWRAKAEVGFTNSISVEQSTFIDIISPTTLSQGPGQNGSIGQFTCSLELNGRILSISYMLPISPDDLKAGRLRPDILAEMDYILTSLTWE